MNVASRLTVVMLYSRNPATANMMMKPKRLSGTYASEALDFLELVDPAASRVADGL